jgi:serine/threonine protein kinase
LNVNIDTDDTQHSTWDKRSKHAFTAAESEIRILSHKTIRSNENIVTLLGISFQVRSIGSSREPLALPVLVEELAFQTPDGQPATLSEDIKTNPIGANPALKMMFLLDIARGLLDLHQLNIVHADLKPSNILLFPHSSGRAVAKISDFGFCQSIDVEDPAQGSTPYWAAPESLPEAGEDMKPWRNSTNRDLYSFGLLIWYVLFEDGPFGDEESFDYATMAREKLEESMKEKIDKQLHLSYRFHSQDPILLEGSWLPQRLFQVMTDGTQQEVELELESLSDQIVSGSIQEQFQKPGQGWEKVKSFADGYAILQVIHFFLSFFLVRDPPLRIGLNFFLEMTSSK